MRSMCIHVYDVCIIRVFLIRLDCSLFPISLYVRCVCVYARVCTRAFFFSFSYIRHVHTFAVHMHHRLYVCLSTCVALSLLNVSVLIVTLPMNRSFTFRTLQLTKKKKKKTLHIYIYIYKTYALTICVTILSHDWIWLCRAPTVYRHRGFSSFPFIWVMAYTLYGVHGIYI